MANPTLDETLQILQLVAGVEPIVLGFIKNILSNAQGKTGDQFIAEADTIWDDVAAKAKAELGQT